MNSIVLAYFSESRQLPAFCYELTSHLIDLLFSFPLQAHEYALKPPVISDFFPQILYFQGMQKAGAENPQIFHSRFLLIFMQFYNYSSSVVSSGSLIASPSSSNCFSSTVPGASVIRQEASFTFGNAITSRIESACTICITIRSKP